MVNVATTNFPNGITSFGGDVFPTEYVVPYGANGDGTGNDADAINAAAAIATARGASLVGGGRTYRITSQVTLPLKSQGFVFDASSYSASTTVATGITGIYPVVCTGTDIWASGYPTIAVTSSITRGDQAIVVASTTTLSAGDVVLVYENVAWTANFAAGKKAEVKTVDSVDSLTGVTFTAPMECNYTTAATVRKYANEEAYLSDIKVIGCGGSTIAMTGLAITNLRRVTMSGSIETRDCPKAGVVASNCAQVTAAYIGGENLLLAGFAYVWGNSGCHNVSIDRVFGINARHVVSNGNGLGGGQMSRKVAYGIVEGLGCRDAVFDCHPPVADIQVGMVIGSCGGADASSGDGFICQGSRLQVGSINVTGFRRDGVFIQPYGDGDGVEPTFYIGSIFARGAATAQYAFAFSDSGAATGSYTFSSLHVGHIDAVSANGIFIQSTKQILRRAEFNGGRSEVLTTGFRAFRAQNAAPGAILQVVLSGSEFVALATTSTVNAVYIQGDASNTILARLLGCKLVNGTYNLRADYGTVKTDVDYSGSTTGTTLAGTGGTITAAQYA